MSGSYLKKEKPDKPGIEAGYITFPKRASDLREESLESQPRQSGWQRADDNYTYLLLREATFE